MTIRTKRYRVLNRVIAIRRQRLAMMDLKKWASVGCSQERRRFPAGLADAACANQYCGSDVGVSTKSLC
jgi:hypothetical protein